MASPAPSSPPAASPAAPVAAAPSPPILPPPVFDQAEREEARRLNERLRRMPRFRMRGWYDAVAIRALIGAAQLRRAMRPAPWLPRAETRWIAGPSGRGVALRILHPPGPARGLYLDIHGGAWAVGNARMDDAINAAIVHQCGLATASVEYRLLPRHSLSDAIADCEAAARWALDAAGSFGGPVFVGGESAGAHLAACALLRLRDRAPSRGFDGAVLFYGAYDLAGTGSVRAAGPDTLVLHGPGMARSLPRLLPGLAEEARRHPRWSPLHADLGGLPPALLIVGELDPLLDDTLAMAARWQARNNNAALLRAPDSPHAFNRFGTRIAARTNAHVRAWLAALAAAKRRPGAPGS